MADAKRWTVTYTKHLKQKRKVYQDGFLVLHTSTNKVKLYDESETLLECRIQKDGEIVESGETLTFNTYLIDVGDPVGEVKPYSDLKNSSLERNKFVNPSVSTDQKRKVEKRKVQQNSLSPSQKIIREFKKREMHKYGNVQRSPDLSKTSAAEWDVLYTTQLTQKAKKYHDGFLRCPNSGSLGRQVMLYDESWKLLESRFLKKGEEVRSGETMEFHSHMVEVGERRENSKSLPDLPAEGERSTSCRKLEMLKQQNDANKSVLKEWQVLYTTQITQKAKKYHDGFLQLVTCGSFGSQIMLYDASRKLLDNRFLKKEEMIRSGDSITFDAHLVDIGEPEVQEELLPNLNNSGNSCRPASETRISHMKCKFPEVIKSMERVESPQEACAVKNVSAPGRNSCLENQKPFQEVPKDKPLRDAFGILSILQRPAAEESIASKHGLKSMVTFDSSTKEIQEPNAVTVDSTADSQLQSALRTEPGSCENYTGSAGPRHSASPVTSGACISSALCGSNDKEGKSPTECASEVNEEWPSFDLGF